MLVEQNQMNEFLFLTKSQFVHPLFAKIIQPDISTDLENYPCNIIW